ncbi:MAG: methyl-accepting chemotaxis protein [Oceanospirillaceae bacterium]|nr:methyl-accepting chemotaxis protein [Oceanospirillaceae bacterium]
MQNFTIKQAVMVLAGTVLLVLLGIGIFILRDVQQLRALLEHNEQMIIPMIRQGYEAQINTIQVQQWLTDISATRAQDGLADGFDQARIAYEGFQTNLQQLSMLDAAQQDYYRSIQPVFEDYYAMGQRMAHGYIADGPATGNKLMASFDTTAQAITDKVGQLNQRISHMVAADSAGARKTLDNHINLLVICYLILLGVLGILFAFIVQRVLRPARHIANGLGKMAQGDLTQMVQVKSQDEMGEIAAASARIVQKFQAFITKIIGSSNMNSGYSYALLFSVQDAVKFVEKQTEESAGVRREVQALCDSTGKVQNVVEQAVSETAQARNHVSNSRDTLSEANNIVHELGEHLNHAEVAITDLARQCQSINTVVGTISAIAEQTNLLALNAAIEAARAGEQGRGFAVVADEVRALAQRTQESTGEIRQTVDALQKLADNAVVMINKNKSVAGRNADMSAEVISSLQTVFDYIESLYALNKSIHDLTDEQQHHINGISGRSESIASLSASVSERIARADRFSRDMRESIKAFTEISSQVRID